MGISGLIAELLHDYDCVIIPGFGGFIGNYSHAFIHPVKEIAYPPSKRIIFNKNLQSNDGLLANALVQKTHISYADANALIEEFVKNCKAELQKGNKVVFEGLGFIFADAEQNPQFKTDYSINFLTDSFGLFPVPAKQMFAEKTETNELQFKPAPKTTKKEEVKHDKSEETKIVILKPNPAKKWKYIAAAAILVPFAFYSVWIPAKTDFLQTGKINVADLNPFKSYQERKYFKNQHNNPGAQIKENIIINPLEYTDLLIDENEKFIIKPESDKLVNIAETTFVYHPIRENNLGKTIHIIGGCFREINNAYNLIKALNEQGYDAYILDEAAGLHRVAIAGYNKQSEALKALKEIREKGHPAAWILNK